MLYKNVMVLWNTYGWCFCISAVDFTVCTALNRHMSTYNHQGETNSAALAMAV